MSDHAWWTPVRRKLYGRPTVNGMTCQICGCDMCQCNRLVPVSDPPRTATIGEHVDAVLAAKDAEIERLRAEKATDAWHTGWQEAVRRMQQAERQLAEAVALLRDGAVLIRGYGDGKYPDYPEGLLVAIDEWLARLDAFLAGGR